MSELCVGFLVGLLGGFWLGVLAVLATIFFPRRKPYRSPWLRISVPDEPRHLR